MEEIPEGKNLFGRPPRGLLAAKASWLSPIPHSDWMSSWHQWKTMSYAGNLEILFLSTDSLLLFSQLH